MAKIKGREMQTQGQHTMCYRKGNRNPQHILNKVSLSIFSLEAQHFVGIRGIYTRVRMECEELGFSKQSWLVAWTRDLTEPQVPAVRQLNG